MRLWREAAGTKAKARAEALAAPPDGDSSGATRGAPAGEETMEYDDIIDAVNVTLAHRDSRRDILAARIKELAEPAMAAARVRRLELGDECGWTLAYRRPEADCSQWSNRIDHPDHIGESELMIVDHGDTQTRSLGPAPDLGFFDGSNRQHQVGPTRDHLSGQRIRPATVAQLRSVAVALPAALAELLASTAAQAAAEAEEADAAAAELEVTRSVAVALPAALAELLASTAAQAAAEAEEADAAAAELEVTQ